MSCKIGLLETIIFCCFPICSFYKKFDKETVKLKKIFKRNPYPEKTIDRCTYEKFVKQTLGT